MKKNNSKAKTGMITDMNRLAAITALEYMWFIEDTDQKGAFEEWRADKLRKQFVKIVKRSKRAGK